MFADPQSITYATVAKSLAAVGRSEDASAYQLNDSGVVYKLRLSHQFKPSRTRGIARIQRDSFVSDSYTPANSILASMTATLTLDFPTTGLTATNAVDLANALVAWATPANLLKLANGET